MKAMILAAGLGKRMRPLTEVTPKPLLMVAGKPLLQHHIERLAAAGITELVINTSWLAQQVEDYFGDGSDFGVSISWSREALLLETGGGIARALPMLGTEPFVLINGDVWTDFPIHHISVKTLEQEQDAWLLLVNNPEHNPKGDFGLSAQLVSFNGNSCFTFSGISLMRPQLFATYQSNNPGQETFRWLDVMTAAIEQGRVAGELYSGQWWDVGTVERYHQLNQHLA
jgi:MurNAc alpha-1-phosphate uridylyltransferase